jgi:hypothetical protein
MVPWYTMISSSPTKKTKGTRRKQGGIRTLAVTVFEETASELEELADEQGVSIRTLLHEAMALAFRKHGVSLPPALVEYLETHGRRIPPRVRQKAKHELN